MPKPFKDMRPHKGSITRHTITRTDTIARNLLKYKPHMSSGSYTAARKHLLAGDLDKAQNFIDAAHLALRNKKK